MASCFKSLLASGGQTLVLPLTFLTLLKRKEEKNYYDYSQEHLLASISIVFLN
jgi:hypothetical protein